MRIPDKKMVLVGSEQCVWLMHLLLVAWAALLSQSFYSALWLSFGCALTALSALYYVFILFYPYYNDKSLRGGAPIITCLILTIVWIGIQNYSGLFITVIDFYDGAISPAWFQAERIVTFSSSAVQVALMQLMVCLVMFVNTLCLVRTRRRLKQLLLLFTALMLFHVAIGVSTKLTGIILVERALLDGHYDAARGWFVNRNHFAAMINLCLFGGLALGITAIWRRTSYMQATGWRSGVMPLRPEIWFYATALSLGVLALVMAESRAAFLGLFGSLFVVLGIATRIEINFIWSRFAMALSVLLAILMLAMFGEQLLTRLLSESISLGERTKQWQQTLMLIKQRPIFGYGVGSYEAVFQYQREFGVFREVIFDQAHNEFLHLWLEQGLVGLLLWWLVLGLFACTAIWQYLRCTSRFIKAIILAGLISFLAITLQSLVDFNMQITSLRVLFFVLMATVISATTVTNKRQ